MTSPVGDDPYRLKPLLGAALTGDRGAWNELLTHVRPYLQLIVRRRLHLSAEPQGLDDSSLVQETLVRIDANFARGSAAFAGSDVPAFLAWIRRITVNTVVDAQRRATSAGRDVRRKTNDPLAFAGLVQGRLPEQSASDAELIVRLAAAIEALGPDENRTITLRYYARLSFKEIAALLARPEGTVRVIHMRALQMLQTMLGDAT